MDVLGIAGVVMVTMMDRSIRSKPDSADNMEGCVIISAKRLMYVFCYER